MAKKVQARKRGSRVSRPQPKAKAAPSPSRSLTAKVAPSRRGSAEEAPLTAQGVIDVITRALGTLQISSPLSNGASVPPATYVPSQRELQRAESELFHGVDDSHDSPSFPDSSGVWAGSGQADVEIAESPSDRERLLSFMGHTEAKIEVLKNQFNQLRNEVNELLSFHRASRRG